MAETARQLSDANPQEPAHVPPVAQRQYHRDLRRDFWVWFSDWLASANVLEWLSRFNRLPLPSVAAHTHRLGHRREDRRSPPHGSGHLSSNTRSRVAEQQQWVYLGFFEVGGGMFSGIGVPKPKGTHSLTRAPHVSPTSPLVTRDTVRPHSLPTPQDPERIR